MRKVTLKGDSYEMGRQYGEIMKKESFDLSEPSDKNLFSQKRAKMK